MTSISPAQPRPPLLNFNPSAYRALLKTPPQLLRTPTREGKHVEQGDEIDFSHERPVKRRKTSSDSLAVPDALAAKPFGRAQSRYQGAPWTTVVRVTADSSMDRPAEPALPPLPDKPWGPAPSREHSLQDTRPPVRVRKNIAVPNTPDSIEIPNDAPLFEQRRRADYFPWTGKHPEDVLSEGHVSKGYSDRPPNPPEKELNTAKAPLYNAFKHRSGLDSLSALFSVVLDAKSKHGTFSSTSTFKGPPPRVTLTEAKRKSWISDLANPEVPLRRLSKTIPQGIRGQSLLEQCLQNNIPLSRAIWFTKCVGANEIRTLKRKGVNPAVSQGAEIKWLREWTSNIEQFIESVLLQCGQKDWKDRIRYAVLLAARLYLENLLDRDHYLEWILKSLSAAGTNHWPFWLMMVHLHRIDLIAFRKKGKQLAETLIVKYNLAHAAPGEALQPLAQNFAAAIRALISTRPNCFLMPDKWTECHKALSSCLSVENEAERQTFEYLKFVNERIHGVTKQRLSAQVSSFEQVVDLLDSFKVHTTMPSLYESLCQACPDHHVLMEKCLEWSVSRFRTGQTRIYLAARLFRKLRKQGHDVDAVLLDFIFNRMEVNNLDASALKHFVSELSRSHTFPISKYMQWLSVRGLPRPGSMSHLTFPLNEGTPLEYITVQESNDTQQLLTEVCLLHREDHLVNLRNSLLDRAGFDEDLETSAFECLKPALSNGLAEPDKPLSKQLRSRIPFGRIPWTLRTRISYWLRTEIVALCKASQTEIPGKPPLPGSRSLTLGRFHFVRDVLERSGDLAILADVLRITSTSKREDVLAAAVDTINMHASTLVAIGALEPLQLIYGQTYVALRSVKTTMPLYASALINLCQQYPIKSVPVRALQQDLVRGDRGRAVTAFSPFSDGVAESLQQAGATFHDDFEAILQTESNMNEQTMIRLFRVLIERIEKSLYVEQPAHELMILCQLLARLKLCQKSPGDLFVKKWITKLCSSSNPVISAQLLFGLICTRCIQLETLIEICQQLPADSASRHRLYSCIRCAITNDVDDSIDEELFYGFRLAVNKLIATKPVELLDIVGSDETGRSSNTATKQQLISAILINSELIKALSKPAWLVVSQSLSENLRDISASDPLETQARALATSADPLSLPFCSLRMRMLCQNTATKNDETLQEEIATMLCAMAADPTSSLATSPRTFQNILRATGPVLSAKVRSNMEQSFFNALPRFLQSKGLNPPPIPTEDEVEYAARALQQMLLVSADLGIGSQTSGISGLVEKLTIFMKTLGPSSNASQPIALSSPASTTAQTTPHDHQSHPFLVASLDPLNFLLQMLCVKRTALNSFLSQPSPAVAKSLQQDQIKLVGLLISIGTHSVWPSLSSTWPNGAEQIKIRDTIDFAFDLAAILVDDMSDESRAFCARILKDKIKDGRVRWLLGSINSLGSVQTHDMGHGYQVIHETKGVLGDWKPKMWELLESGASGDSCLGLGLFGARKV